MNGILCIKKNNKGNTLPIVLVGIFVLAILGTLILGMTATNFKIKVTEKKSESTFYYAEKAIDEVYAGIGNEVMQCAKMSYQEVMENYVYDAPDPADPTKTITTTLGTTGAEDKFKELYLLGNAASGGSINGIENLYPESGDITVIGNVLTRLSGYIKNVSGINTQLVAKYGTGTADKTYIQYVKDAGKTKEILIKNVCVKTLTTSSGYYSSLLVDFKIKVPSVSFNITDSVVPAYNNVDNLASYTMIAQGDTVSDVNKNNKYYPTILVQNGKSLSVKGNVYAGTLSDWVYTGNMNDSEADRKNNVSLWRERSAIAVDSSASLKVESKNVVCDGPVTVAGGSIDFRGVGGFGTGTVPTSFSTARFTENADVLNLYATDLITENNNSNINVIGNCIISDDMEINGNQSNVAIKGNYYGYGFQAVNDAQIVGMINSNIKEADSGVTETGFVSPNSLVKEHQKRSAIIVNGKNADVDLTGLNTLILAGRAYIDLDSGTQYGNASYMTGESISFKGNQQMYLADENSGLAGANSNLVNPIDFSALSALTGVGDNMELDAAPRYSDLNLDSSKVVAKKVKVGSGAKVYFYNKNLDPITQSRYFVTTYFDSADGSAKQKEADELVSDTLQVENLKFKAGLNYYTVGTFMSVENRTLKVSSSYNTSAHSPSFTSDRFYNLVKEMRIRKSYMTPTLFALDYKTENPSIYNGMTVSSSTETVYEHYVDESAFTHEEQKELLRDNRTVTYNGVTDTVAHFIQSITGKTIADAPSYHVGFYVDSNAGTSSTNPDLDEGIWISAAPINVSKDFKGIVITKSSITVTNDANIETSEELIKFMLTCDDPNGVFTNLRKALRLQSSSQIISMLDIASDDISYMSMVEKSNWRKNTN